LIVLQASQTIAGVDDCESSFESKSKDEKAKFYKGLTYAIVNSIGVDENNIKNLTAYCIARRLDTASVGYWRRLAEWSSSMYVSYIVKVRNPKTNYQSLSLQLQDSVDDGNFAKLLMEASTLYNIPAFSNVTSNDITIEDVTIYPPSSNPTLAPSIKPTLAPAKKKSSKNKLSGGEIAGIVIGCVAFLAIVVFGTAYCCLVIQPAAEAGKASYTAASTAGDQVAGELELTDKV